MRTRITPSLLIASLALAVAVSGGAGYAAGSLPHHSVGAAQLKKNAVTGKAIKAGAVTGDKVADGSLSGADLAANSVTGTQVDESSLSIPLRPGSVLLSGLDYAPRSSSDVTTSSSDGGSPATAVSTPRTSMQPCRCPREPRSPTSRFT